MTTAIQGTDVPPPSFPQISSAIDQNNTNWENALAQKSTAADDKPEALGGPQPSDPANVKSDPDASNDREPLWGDDNAPQPEPLWGDDGVDGANEPQDVKPDADDAFDAALEELKGTFDDAVNKNIQLR